MSNGGDFTGFNKIIPIKNRKANISKDNLILFVKSITKVNNIGPKKAVAFPEKQKNHRIHFLYF